MNIPIAAKIINNHNGSNTKLEDGSMINLNSEFSYLIPNANDDLKILSMKNAKLRTLLIKASEKISEIVSI